MLWESKDHQLQVKAAKWTGTVNSRLSIRKLLKDYPTRLLIDMDHNTIHVMSSPHLRGYSSPVPIDSWIVLQDSSILIMSDADFHQFFKPAN